MRPITLANRHTLDELIELKNKCSDNGQKIHLRAIIGIKRGKHQKQIAEELMFSEKTIGIWRK
jgi:FixJ family two-component response regulator